MLPFLVAVLLETRFATLDAGLATAAQASPRPHECRGAASGEDGVWLRLRGADAQRYCDLLARGYARLSETPKEALSAAQAADALAGNTTAVRVLTGRAQLRLGQSAPAYEQFASAEAAQPQAFSDPKTLHDYARAASLAGKSESALRLYRLLVSRAALLSDARERAFCQIETAAHVLAHAANGSDEALGYLAQMRQQSLGLSPWINGLRLLASRRGAHAEQRRVASVAASAASLGAPPPAGFSDEFPLLPPGMFEALRAALTEPSDPTASPAKGKAR